MAERLRLRREYLLGLLAGRSFPLSAETKARVNTCRRIEVLRGWTKRVASAATLDDIFRG